MFKSVLAGLALFAAAAPALAACPDPEAIARLAADWTARTPAAVPAVENLADAQCGQAALVELLKPSQGAVVGYKAALTTRPAQERFGATEPVRGVLLKNMLLSDGATVPANFGARPLWEADMLLQVKDDGINDATTPEQVLAHVSAMLPFIELPDLVVKTDIKMKATVLTLVNAGARAGVVGAPVPLENSPETMAALSTVAIVARDGDGATLATGIGTMALKHPLNAALWLVQSLNAAGARVKAGDLLSLGSFTPLTPPKAGQKITVSYEGLPGGGIPTVAVQFQ